MVEKQKKLAVVRVRGKIHLSEPIKATLDMLHLYNKNWCVVIDDSPSNRGMVKKVKDFVTWGEVDDKTHEELFEKRGELFKERTEDNNSKIKYKNYVVHKSKKYKKYFRLSPPKAGYGRAGTKESFTKKGALGNRKEKINDLLKRMM